MNLRWVWTDESTSESTVEIAGRALAGHTHLRQRRGAQKQTGTNAKAEGKGARRGPEIHGRVESIVFRLRAPLEKNSHRVEARRPNYLSVLGDVR